MNWAGISKILGLIVAALPHIIQLIGILTTGSAPIDPVTASAASGVGMSAFFAGVGKTQSDNTKRIKLGLASEPHPIPVEKQDAAIKVMESGGKV